MARVNITIPDPLVERARAAGLNISALVAAAVAEELDRREKVAALDVYLSELEAERGPIPERDLVAARTWADRVLSTAPSRSA